jgi:hypothetical protein
MWFFTELIYTMKGWSFQYIVGVQQHVMAVLKVHRYSSNKILQETL